MTIALVSLAGLVYGIGAGLCASVVVAKGRHLSWTYRYPFLALFGGLVLVLIEGLGMVRESVLFRSWADPALYDTFHRVAVVAAVGMGLVGLWRLLVAQPRGHVSRSSVDSPLLASNLMASVGGSVLVSLLTYIAVSPLLPERGPLWGVPLLFVGCAVVCTLGFVAGHILWLYTMASRYPVELILEAIGEAGRQGTWHRMSTAVLRAASRS